MCKVSEQRRDMYALPPGEKSRSTPVNTTGPKERERAFDLIEDTVQAHVHDILHSTKSVGKRRTFEALKRGDAHTDHDVREQSGTADWRMMAQSFDLRDIWSRRLAACELTVETPHVEKEVQTT